MPEYIVYREEGPDRRPVARLFADDAEAACRQAATEVQVAAGQRLIAEPADRVDAREVEISRRVEALDQGS